MDGRWVRKPRNGKAFVFVHGILSNGEACWRHPNGSYWPTLVADEATLELFGIYVFTYLTDVFSGSYRIGDIVDAFKEHARLDDVLTCDQIVW